MYFPVMTKPFPDSKSPANAEKALRYAPLVPNDAAKKAKPSGDAPPIKRVRDNKKAHTHFKNGAEITAFFAVDTACP